MDQNLKNKLDQIQAEYNPADWSAMNDMLDGKDRTAIAWWRSNYAIAALLLLFVGGLGAMLYFNTLSSDDSSIDLISSKSNSQSEQEINSSETNSEAAKAIIENSDITKSKTLDNNSDPTLLNSTATNSLSSTNDNAVSDNNSLASSAPILGSNSLAKNKSTYSSGQADHVETVSSSSPQLTGTHAEIDMVAAIAANHGDAGFNDINSSGIELVSNYPVPWVRASNLAFDPESKDFLNPKEVASFQSPKSKKRKAAVHFALIAQGGLNSAYTALGDGFRPSWDAGIGAELHVNKVFFQSGVRYGKYQFDQTEVACYDGINNFGLTPSQVTCASNLRGDISMLEIPLAIGFRKPLKKGNGQFRFYAGPVVQLYKSYDYLVRFEDVKAGETLFFDPYIITSIDAQTEVEVALSSLGDGRDIQALVGTDIQDPGALNGKNSNLSLAIEAGFGYEQFLGKKVSLSAEPRITLPTNTLLINDRRTMVASVTAKLRWYPTATLR
ncbi:MAG: hypothetical protein ACI959_001284 [Limisphaerales bacterium]|jgi:hypothetical protein